VLRCRAAASPDDDCGLLIACLPDRVRTFLFHAGDSTWDNPNRADPPLPRHNL
jgi:hypothetical protein